MLRRDVKNKHENAVLKNFTSYLKAKGIKVELLCKPDPPDAIVIINGEKSWIEITDAFLNPELAESITSFISEDRPHKPVPGHARKTNEPDKSYDERLSEIINQKYKKMKLIYDRYGPGILLVGIQNPYSSAACLSLNAVSKPEKFDPLIFREMYFYDTSGSAFEKVVFANE